MIEIENKRGDTISWECSYVDDAGSKVDITNYVISCEARNESDTNELLFSVSSSSGTIDVYDAINGLFRIIIDTSSFSIGSYVVDIQYVYNGLVKSSDTFRLKIIEDVTK